MSKCMEGIWRVRYATEICRHGSWAEIAKLYMFPCPNCNASVLRLYSSDPSVCTECRSKLNKEFDRKKMNARYRVRYRAFKKQLAEIGRLLAQARKLVHENNE